jgi:hypothetical protein
MNSGHLRQRHFVGYPQRYKNSLLTLLVTGLGAILAFSRFRRQ